ncbi:LIC12162 family transferase [Candidatus Pelagibacter sp. FZCC0015]|uniref:LIC12162 family transferase n=1 Tax=Candidatus Pelagibacter sp. FZCC0015 TaxID=2268451 RepID=UPI00143DD5AA|nr:LIC12162 family protein [Candidatus Pelagibacter sp. FZCC0015]
MNNQKRYLITTADEKTWKFDRPVIFLGEWCRLYNRKEIWQTMDAIVAEPYGVSLHQKNSDHSESLILEEKLFPELCGLLNKHHQKNYSQRFWRIIIGHWFKHIVRDILNRVHSIKECLKNHEISGTTVYESDVDTLVSTDFITALYSPDNYKWHNILNARIISLIEEVSFPVEILKTNSVVSDYESIEYKSKKVLQGSLKKSIFNWSCRAYGKIANKFVRDKDAFVINSYLPTIEEIKLELALGQVPQLWKMQGDGYNLSKFSQKQTDVKLRNNLKNMFSKNRGGILENVIRQLSFELLPKCYLEGFSDLHEIVKKRPWPKSPKFIFTSNSFYQNEVFKLWSALKVEDNTKYFVGQHGCNYGTQKHKFPRIEEITSDKFITWGWTDGLPQHTPGFIFKTSGNKKLNFDPKGSLLLVQEGFTKNDNTHDRKFEYIQYLNDQKKFVSQLDKEPRQKLIVRLFNVNYQSKEWCDELRWADYDKMIKIDKGISNINNLILQSRLVVHSYDSTGILETLSLNVPTLAFWQNGFDHLRDSAKPYYQLLVDAGIVHFSTKSVADKVNAIWDDVNNWWSQENVQNARKKFCMRYSNLSQKPAAELKQILLS